MEDVKKIVILGSGYAGVKAAKLLEKKYKKNQNVEITLIGKDPYHTLMTELHEVAGGRVEPDSVQINLKRIFGARRVNVVIDEITKINFEDKTLISESSTYEFDYLVLGAGSEPAFFGIPGVKENGFTIWSFDDAVRIREHIEKMFIKAAKEKNPEKRKSLLTFVVCGAGFTGVETIGELVEFKKRLCRNYYIDEKEVRLVIVEAMDKILPILNDKLIAKAERYLNRKGVEVIKKTPLTKVNTDSIELKDGTVISTQTLIWTSGIQASKFASSQGLTTSRAGRIQVNEFMQSIDFKNVYVVGDNAYFEEEQGKGIPQIVETALQTAETAVHNIVADIENKPLKAFKSNFHGLMVSIGSRYSVASVMEISMSGFIATAMKHLVNLHYLFFLGGFSTVWSYLIHEFFNVKEGRSLIGGHLSAKSHSFWIAILRVYVGVMWLIEGIKKIQDGWLTSGKVYILSTVTDAASGASAQGAEGAANAATTATSTVIPIISQPPAIFKWFMNTFVAPIAYPLQCMVVIAEIGIGLALIAGLFTFLASLASIALGVNFVLSAMAGWDILWYIFAAFALMGGAGRAFGLDYYVMPWLQKWWNKTNLAKKTYIYIEPEFNED